MPNRFRDQNLTLNDFNDEFIFVCPDCGQKLISKNNIETFQSLLTCTNCPFKYSFDNSFYNISLIANCNNCGEKIEYSSRSKKEKTSIQIPCVNCKEVHRFKPKNHHFKSFGLILKKYSLWYSETFRGKHFWAYNAKHLEYIESYVKADLRQRQNRTHATLVEKLPKFIKSAKNREELLKLIAKIKKK